ncbi:D-xylose ABC transporter substrate-binding protein [Saccharibacillus sp. O23]|uniref:D-xylose ABC transporter substrate-binding protein n=1 Tax=Saccharibacillus sp. O23 TaxID=2009338 RepID=UPI000B4E7972|nr:D-xylose ABC transporter substrate-binding protein [Saccharibacillus sp. O23]OWR30978.1 D-xylose ABC transporter substrate-binding protein [Saccharibacillus sp. O23]
MNAREARGSIGRERTSGAPQRRTLSALRLSAAAALLALLLSACSGGGQPPQAAPGAAAGAQGGQAEAGGAPAGTGDTGSASGEALGGSGEAGTSAAPAEGAEAGTSGAENPPPAEAALPGLDASGRPLVIGFSMDTLLEERWKKDRDLFRAAAEKLGAQVVVKSADGDDARQVAQAEAMISQGVDVLVVVPHNAEATAAIVSKAHKEGIKVLSYDRLITNADVDLYVSFDNVEVGRLQAKAMLSLVPEGNYAYIGGAATDNNAHQFKQGVFDILQPLIDRGDIRIVYDQWSKDWKPLYALDNMREALAANGPTGIDAVIAANDATGGSVVEALGERGLAGKIPVAGQDADLAAIRRIAAGTQTMTVYKPIGRLAEETAKLAVALAQGEKPLTSRWVNNGKIEVPSILLPPIAVDANNIDSTVIKDGFHTRAEVYGSGK